MKEPSSLASTISLRHALGWILLSIIIVNGSALLGIVYYKHVRAQRIHDPKFTIVALIQKSSGSFELKTSQLVEMLDLAVDRPLNLYRFNIEEAKNKLIETHVFKDVIVKRISPGTVLVEYRLREPMAFLMDYANTVIDRDGIAFQLNPYFTPKKLPEIYLGIPECEVLWGSSVAGERLRLAFQLLDFISKRSLQLHAIDVSKAFAASYGEREIVLTIDRGDRKEMLRMGPERYQESINQYFELLQHFAAEPEHAPIVNTIDFRIPRLGFITSQ